MQTTRLARLSQELQQEIALIIHQELKDPRLGFVTITRLELSKDLRYGKVLYSCLGNSEERALSQKALESAVGFIHSLIKKRFRLKVIPELTFRYDTSIEGSITLSNTLEELKHQSGQQPTG